MKTHGTSRTGWTPRLVVLLATPLLSGDLPTSFEEPFAGSLRAGWSWTREDRSAWRLGNGQLEVRTQPGNLWGPPNNGRNLLHREIPVVPGGVVEVQATVKSSPEAQYEQAGIAWYIDDSNMVKLMRERVDGKLCLCMGREEGDRTRTVALFPIEGESCELRLHLEAAQVTGSYRVPGGEQWIEAGTCTLPGSGAARLCLQTYGGVEGAERWAQFGGLRVTGLPAPPALERAHAHNDYAHARPLLDALAQGFTSVEADIFLVDGKLLVGHDVTDLRPARTLEALYLDPLERIVRANGGAVVPGGKRFLLLIDLKSEAEATYAELERTLERYGDLLTRVSDGKETPGPVRVILSGERPIVTLSSRSSRRAGYDGRLEDLSSAAPGHLLPLVSDNWSKHFQWRGQGPIPREDRLKLEEIVTKAHAAGRLVRFWAAPDRPEAWELLRDAGVDLINTDRLEPLAKFLRDPPRLQRL